MGGVQGFDTEKRKKVMISINDGRKGVISLIVTRLWSCIILGHQGGYIQRLALYTKGRTGYVGAI